MQNGGWYVHSETSKKTEKNTELFLVLEAFGKVNIFQVTKGVLSRFIFGGRRTIHRAFVVFGIRTNRSRKLDEVPQRWR